MAFSHEEECNGLYREVENDDEARRSLSGRLLRGQKLEQCNKRLALRWNYFYGSCSYNGVCSLILSDGT